MQLLKKKKKSNQIQTLGLLALFTLIFSLLACCKVVYNPLPQQWKNCTLCVSHAHSSDNWGHAAPCTGRVRPVFHMFLSLILPLPCWALCWLFSLKAFNKTTTRSLQLPSYVIYLDTKNVPSQNPSTCSSPMYKPWHLLVPIPCTAECHGQARRACKRKHCGNAVYRVLPINTLWKPTEA